MRARGGDGGLGHLHRIRANPDPSNQVYEKDVILGDDVDVRRDQREGESFKDKRVRVNQIEREELSEEEV